MNKKAGHILHYIKVAILLGPQVIYNYVGNTSLVPIHRLYQNSLKGCSECVKCYTLGVILPKNSARSTTSAELAALLVPDYCTNRNKLKQITTSM